MAASFTHRLMGKFPPQTKHGPVFLERRLHIFHQNVWNKTWTLRYWNGRRFVSRQPTRRWCVSQVAFCNGFLHPVRPGLCQPGPPPTLQLPCLSSNRKFTAGIDRQTEAPALQIRLQRHVAAGNGEGNLISQHFFLSDLIPVVVGMRLEGKSKPWLVANAEACFKTHLLLPKTVIQPASQSSHTRISTECGHQNPKMCSQKSK